MLDNITREEKRELQGQLALSGNIKNIHSSLTYGIWPMQKKNKPNGELKRQFHKHREQYCIHKSWGIPRSNFIYVPRDLRIGTYTYPIIN